MSYLYGGVGLLVLLLAGWGYVEHTQILTLRLTISQYQTATAQAEVKAKETADRNKQTAQEISDANDAQVKSMADAITTLLMRKPSPNRSASVPAPTTSTPIADAGALRQPSGGNPASADCPAVPDRSDTAAVLGTAILGWEQVRSWRQWQRQVSQSPTNPSPTISSE